MIRPIFPVRVREYNALYRLEWPSDLHYSSPRDERAILCSNFTPGQRGEREAWMIDLVHDKYFYVFPATWKQYAYSISDRREIGRKLAVAEQGRPRLLKISSLTFVVKLSNLEPQSPEASVLMGGLDCLWMLIHFVSCVKSRLGHS